MLAESSSLIWSRLFVLFMLIVMERIFNFKCTLAKMSSFNLSLIPVINMHVNTLDWVKYVFVRKF
jgi:hypothetical protein